MAENLVIAHLVFDGFWELDALGPWEVFTSARLGKARIEPLLISPDGGEVSGAKGLCVRADHGFGDAPAPDIILVPGGRSDIDDPATAPLIDYIRDTAPDCQWVMSVCTGAFLLYGAGLLKGRTVATHWMHRDRLAELAGDDFTVVKGRRYVADGNLLTSAGVSAGIDSALWLTGELFGDDIQRKAIQIMEYAPEPPAKL